MKTAWMLAAMLILAPTLGSAQKLPGQFRDIEQRSWYVRVSGDTAFLAAGRVRTYFGTDLLVGNTRVDVDHVRMIERRINVGGGWKTGALIGAVPFAVLGYALSGLCEGDCDSAWIQGILSGAVVGALAGAAAGQMLNPPKHRWVQIWPNEP